MSLIQTQGLTKSFRRFEKQPGLKASVQSLFHRQYTEKRAVAHFDLSVAPGEFVGLIGPNGAGKTTLIKMLTGIIPPTSGALSVLGHTPSRMENAFKRQYALVMGQKSQLLFELTAADTFTLFKALYEIPDDQYRHNVDYLTTLFEVKDQLNVQVRTLSLGERMKMELIVALLHSPKLLLLDEPTIGLDAVAQRQMRTFLRQVNREKGTTILLTSHYMEDIRSLCPRCVVINHGSKLYDGGLDTLLHTYQQHKIITAAFASPREVVLPPHVIVEERNPYRLRLLVDHGAVQSVLKTLIDQGDVADIAVEEEDIGLTVERIYAAKQGEAQ